MPRKSRGMMTDEGFDCGQRRTGFAAHGNERVTERMKTNVHHATNAVFPFACRFNAAIVEVLLNMVAYPHPLAAQIDFGRVWIDVFAALMRGNFSENVPQNRMNRNDNGNRLAPRRLARDAPDLLPLHIHFAPFQRGAIAESQAGVG